MVAMEKSNFLYLKCGQIPLKSQLYELLKDRYIMYGEWLYAKHTVFYDNLTHYFMEFDIYDKKGK